MKKATKRRAVKSSSKPAAPKVKPNARKANQRSP
jgi:hypothetical protein